MRRLLLLLVATVAAAHAETIPYDGGSIVREKATIRAAAADGRVLWTRTISTYRADVAGGVLLVRGLLKDWPDTELPDAMRPHDGLLAFEDLAKFVARLDPATGRTVWMLPLWRQDGPDDLKQLVVYRGTVYRSHFGSLLGQDLETGRVTARHWFADPVTGVSPDGDGLRIETLVRGSDVKPVYHLRDGRIEPRVVTYGNLFTMVSAFKAGQSIVPRFSSGGTPDMYESVLDLSRVHVRPPRASELEKFRGIDLNRVLARFDLARELDPTDGLIPFHQGFALRAAGRVAEAEALWERTLRMADEGRIPVEVFAWCPAEFEKLSMPDWTGRAFKVFRRRFFQERPVVFEHQFIITNLILSPLGRVSRLRFAAGDLTRSLTLWGLNREVVPTRTEYEPLHAELLAAWYGRRGWTKEAAAESRRAEELSRDTLMLDSAYGRLDRAVVLAGTGLLMAATLGLALLLERRRRWLLLLPLFALAGELLHAALIADPYLGGLGRSHLALRFGAAALGLAVGLSSISLLLLWLERRRRTPVRGYEVAFGAALLLVVAGTGDAIRTAYWHPGFAIIEAPIGLFSNPDHPAWLGHIRSARTSALVRRFRLAPFGARRNALVALSLAEGVSHQLRGEAADARRVYSACRDAAPCATNLALLDCDAKDTACLVPRLQAALRLPGDRSSALYSLGVLQRNPKQIAEAEALAPFQVGAARQYRPGQLLLAKPDDALLVQSLRYGDATPANVLRTGIRTLRSLE